MILNILISSILASTFLILGEGDGWFPVEKRIKAEEVAVDVDRSLWIFFTKRVGEGRIQVRFPEEPKTIRSESGDLLLRAERGGEVFELLIQTPSEALQTGDFAFQGEDGRWVCERVIKGGEHIYCLRTLSDVPDSPNHKAFISSFAYAG